MAKEMKRSSGKPPSDSKLMDNVLVQLCRDDFRRQEDGSWVTIREITINGHGGVQRLMNVGREFKKGELSIIGLDLATLLEKQCPP